MNRTDHRTDYPGTQPLHLTPLARSIKKGLTYGSLIAASTAIGSM